MMAVRNRFKGSSSIWYQAQKNSPPLAEEGEFLEQRLSELITAEVVRHDLQEELPERRHRRQEHQHRRRPGPPHPPPPPPPGP